MTGSRLEIILKLETMVLFMEINEFSWSDISHITM